MTSISVSRSSFLDLWSTREEVCENLNLLYSPSNYTIPKHYILTNVIIALVLHLPSFILVVSWSACYSDFLMTCSHSGTFYADYCGRKFYVLRNQQQHQFPPHHFQCCCLQLCIYFCLQVTAAALHPSPQFPGRSMIFVYYDELLMLLTREF